MKILTFRRDKKARLGVLSGEDVIDVANYASHRRLHGSEEDSRALEDFPSDLKSTICAGPKAWALLRDLCLSLDISTNTEGSREELMQRCLVYPLDELSIEAPFRNPSKMIAIGQNYEDHCREQDAEPPTSPVVFSKFPSSICGHRDEIVWSPRITNKVDFEVELGVVIGQQARNVSAGDALDFVFGYTVINDVSARDVQFADGQWVRGKSLDTFCPMGPWVITTDEVPDPQNLTLRTVLNGEVMQESTTANMIFPVDRLIEFLSHSFTLEPGDVICTGTPEGVGVFRDPPVFLKSGDRVKVEIDGIGFVRNRCRAVD